MAYHTGIMGVRQEDYKNHEAINTIIMAVKKRICYNDRLKCYDTNTINNIIDGRIRVEKYLELYISTYSLLRQSNCKL